MSDHEQIGLQAWLDGYHDIKSECMYLEKETQRYIFVYEVDLDFLKLLFNKILCQYLTFKIINIYVMNNIRFQFIMDFCHKI